MVDEVEQDVAVERLTFVRDRDVPIMIFVGNPGCIQIFTGPVKTLVETGAWSNLLDPGFNLHLLRVDGICHAHRIRKPTEDGIATSLELQDDNGQPIADTASPLNEGIFGIRHGYLLSYDQEIRATSLSDSPTIAMVLQLVGIQQ